MNLLSQAQCAHVFAVSVTAVANWRKTNSGPRARIIDGKPMYFPEDIRAYIEGRRQMANKSFDAQIGRLEGLK